MRHITISIISPILFLLVSTNAFAVTPTNWITTYDASLYGAGGTITFNDWGYKGPTGVGANDFKVTSPVTGITGFDSSRIGQTQNVVTLNPDWKTRDAAITSTMAEFGPTTARPNTSQDAQVNFFQWTYTTVGGSTFNNMQIDKAGNYRVAKNDMNFQFYDTFSYHDTTGAANNSTVIDTNINFKPYASSDAKGWCGSVLTSNPNGLEVMAGQVMFDLSMDVYMGNARQSLAGGITQIIPDFVMRSYGSYVVDFDRGQRFTGSAVMNNNNPENNPLDVNGEVSGAALDSNYKNQVSFLGGGLIPKGVWLKASSYLSPGVKVLNPDGTWNYTIAGKDTNQLCDPSNLGATASPEAGAVCYGNFFAGYGFLMRADGKRTLTFISPTGFSDYAAVPIPAAVWLLGSGLMGLVGVARRKIAA